MNRIIDGDSQHDVNSCDIDARDAKRPWCRRHRRAIQSGAVLFGLIFIVCITYRDMIFGDWKLSYTNFSYAHTPFAGEGVAVQGPLILSDTADNIIPIAYYAFHDFAFLDWLPTWGIGGSMGVNLYFSPLNYLYVLPMDWAMPLISVIKVLVAFGAMYLFIRQLGYTFRGAFVAATSYALASALIAWQGWPHSEVAMYAPLLFLLLDKALARFRLVLFLGFGVVLFLMLVAGMPTFAAYFMYLAGVYVVVYGTRTYWRQWKSLLAYWCGFALAVVLGVLLSLPYTGGLLTTVGSNGYSDSRGDYSLSKLPLSQLKTLLFPYLPTSANMHFNESTLYTGVLAVLLVTFTIVNLRKKPRAMFFGITTIVLLLLIFTDVLTPVYSHLPVVNSSLKYRIIVVLNFTLSVLAGINADDLLVRAFNSMRDRIPYWIAAGVSTAVFGIVLWRVWPLRDQSTYGPLQIWIACGVAAVFVLIVLARTISGRKVVSMACTAALLCTVSVDMGYFASQYLPMIDKSASSIPQATGTLRYVQSHTTGHEKTVGSTPAWDYFASENMYYDIRDIRGHGFVFTNPDVVAYYTAINDDAYSMSPTLPNFSDIDNVNLLKYLGVKYVFTMEGEQPDAVVEASCVNEYSGGDGLTVHELDEYAPQVQLATSVNVLSDEDAVIDAMADEYVAGSVYFSQESGAPDTAGVGQGALQAGEGVSDIATERDGTMSFTTTTDESRYVVVNEYNDGNWAAYVDGERVPVYKANGLVRAIEVPAGEHTVELRYESSSLRVFLGVCAGSFVVLVILAACSRMIDRKVQACIERQKKRCLM